MRQPVLPPPERAVAGRGRIDEGREPGRKALPEVDGGRGQAVVKRQAQARERAAGRAIAGLAVGLAGHGQGKAAQRRGPGGGVAHQVISARRGAFGRHSIDRHTGPRGCKIVLQYGSEKVGVGGEAFLESVAVERQAAVAFGAQAEIGEKDGPRAEAVETAREHPLEIAQQGQRGGITRQRAGFGPACAARGDLLQQRFEPVQRIDHTLHHAKGGVGVGLGAECSGAGGDGAQAERQAGDQVIDLVVGAQDRDSVDGQERIGGDAAFHGARIGREIQRRDVGGGIGRGRDAQAVVRSRLGQDAERPAAIAHLDRPRGDAGDHREGFGQFGQGGACGHGQGGARPVRIGGEGGRIALPAADVDGERAAAQHRVGAGKPGKLKHLRLRKAQNLDLDGAGGGAASVGQLDADGVGRAALCRHQVDAFGHGHRIGQFGHASGHAIERRSRHLGSVYALAEQRLARLVGGGGKIGGEADEVEPRATCIELAQYVDGHEGLSLPGLTAGSRALLGRGAQ